MKVTIDRFEGEFAVVELPDKSMSNIPRILLPGAKEGDIIRIEVDMSVTAKREDKIKTLIDEVWK